jgi:hypothetical protein
VDLAKEVVGAEVEEEDSVVEAAVEAVVEEVVVAAAVAANQQQQQQQHQRTHREMGSKEYHPPYFGGIPNYSTRSNKNGDYIEPPTSITTT